VLPERRAERSYSLVTHHQRALEEREMTNVLLYGATGFTGKLIAREARARGAGIVLAGRNPKTLKAVAKKLDLDWRAFDLEDRARLVAALKGVSVILNAAGPFSATARPIADACLDNGAHYLDITGEIDVFEALFARDAEAKRAGVTLMPGVGFDVVPSDCLAAHLKRRLPDATHLTLYLAAGLYASRGTLKTMIENVAVGARARRKGRLVTIAQPSTGSCDFGRGLTPTIQVAWGDVSTAFHSTGIPNIDVHIEAAPPLQALAWSPGLVRSLFALSPAQQLLKSLVEFQPEGPTDAARLRGRGVLVGVATNKRETVRARLTTPEGYTLTARTSLDAAKRAAAGDVKPGFQTPSLAFGPDYIQNFEGVTREDLNA
jgi:short subunit dehydrogenase-like uncharacterized protein